MKIVNQTATLDTATDPLDAMRRIERAGRVCYKSEDRITPHSYKNFIPMLLERGHESVLEHAYVTFHIITDRAIANELVRHRIASYSQESTRYVRYLQDIEFIEPSGLSEGQAISFTLLCRAAEGTYHDMLKRGASPQQARSVLPLCTKTELYMTANLREWRHIFKLRCSHRAHPDMRALMLKCLDTLAETYPEVFKDLQDDFCLGGENGKTE